ncbi:4-(cytidine 5'-diphospho)-2-C-methyl-D-erythritol kinase [Gammaproteobacteria bacterium AB-CW1]|uniref:4-diphosphocytidyl-2-C-methyl-D-erythritol kinase n=1 Tax=Natronospira elongata TaxID=3110268 RepID=A0AAP6JED0_9GAMM|nr:4-(cytidine 5'-diphospho)-2-C-methyl-D-erythritol kinase [Gammaproteobacteria bacterium AB-CW1]
MSDPVHEDAQAWPAPAKLNLFIHVLGRRDDGYHDIQTLFQFLDFGDRLTFHRRDDGEMQLSGDLAEVPVDENLVMRAAQALRSRVGRDDLPGVDIQLEKRIPAQGGLGGGSSDAATTLHALNRLWSLKLSEEELAEIGLGLGSDVPVFVHGQAAWAEGRGERLTAVADLPEPCFLVVKPDCAVSTGEIYNAEELIRDSAVIQLQDYLRQGGRNDFQPVVAARYPAVAEALRWLAPYGNPRLTGTGACVFLALDDAALANELLRHLPENWQGFYARACNQSPLRERLGAD